MLSLRMDPRGCGNIFIFSPIPKGEQEQNLMTEDNIERPSDSATNNRKASWSLLQALREAPEGLAKRELVERVRADWPRNFDDHRGVQAVGAALENMKRGGIVRRDADVQKWQVVDFPGLASAPEIWEGGDSSGTTAPPSDAPGGRGAGDGADKESRLYAPVADALVNMGFCTSAVPSGDELNGPMWTNPDAVGLIVPPPFAGVRHYPTKLVAVEIKSRTDLNPLLTGFAEACAYLDFAHISWLVVPWCDDGHAIGRVERLCEIHGVGLAYFHEEKQEEEEEKTLWLEIGVRPRCHTPGAREFAEFLQRLEGKGIKI